MTFDLPAGNVVKVDFSAHFQSWTDWFVVVQLGKPFTLLQRCSHSLYNFAPFCLDKTLKVSVESLSTGVLFSLHKGHFHQPKQ